jgi:hypothetical protein
MTGFRIEVDIEALVRQNWKHMPWRYRVLGLIPGQRKRIEAIAVRHLTEKQEES